VLAYHLTYAQTFAVMGPWVGAPALGIVVLAAITAIRSRPLVKRPGWSASWPLAVGAFGLVVAGWGLFVSLGMAQTGWSLQKGMLQINTGSGIDQWPVGQIEGVNWVTGNPSWSLVAPVSATSTGSYHAGHFRLKNGRVAWVFEEGTHSVLEITVASQIVLISSPRIHKLRRELIQDVTAAQRSHRR
jgi:hypothetical protein